MTVDKILAIMKMGDRKGSALKDLAAYYGCDNYDLSPISNDMADAWISRKKCDCWQQGSWVDGCDTCLGTKEREPCSCDGDRAKCNYYSLMGDDTDD